VATINTCWTTEVGLAGGGGGGGGGWPPGAAMTPTIAIARKVMT
jgi:hypothetical protein